MSSAEFSALTSVEALLFSHGALSWGFCRLLAHPVTRKLLCSFLLGIMHSPCLPTFVSFFSLQTSDGTPTFFFYITIYLFRQPFNAFRQDLGELHSFSCIAHIWCRRNIHIFFVSTNWECNLAAASLSLYCETGWQTFLMHDPQNPWDSDQIQLLFTFNVGEGVKGHKTDFQPLLTSFEDSVSWACISFWNRISVVLVSSSDIYLQPVNFVLLYINPVFLWSWL